MCRPAVSRYGGTSIDPFARPQIDLFAAAVADRHNLDALAACAAMFGTKCFSYVAGGVAAWPTAGGAAAGFSPQEIRREYDLILALDNVAGADDLFAYRPPAGNRIALLVGNERRGLPPGVFRIADRVLRIPTRLHGAASLNVAAAAGAALWQLYTARTRSTHARGKRPDIVFAHPAGAAELGSALRSAWALGWDRAALIDSRGAWFTSDRAAFAEGRGAARRHKNPIKVYPLDTAQPDATYDLVIVVSLRGPGRPLGRLSLPARGRAAVCLPDESGTAAGALSPSYDELARVVIPATLALPLESPAYSYRLAASMALAELARRCAGSRAPPACATPRRPPRVLWPSPRARREAPPAWR